ncbi:hypothetical protein [Bosea sp. Leaf344]|uniref:hypothetical protein n=1 Tax=Bosea sp. Leaf344 TaxID=1736346 RepID=UPI0012E332B2|nr:hypothetical protein [Bosea sp. Leaf344]
MTMEDPTEIKDEEQLDAALERIRELSEFPPGSPERDEAEWLAIAVSQYRRDDRKARRLQRLRRLH